MSITEIRKLVGVKVIKVNATLNGNQAYKIENSFCLYTKQDLENIVCGGEYSTCRKYKSEV